MTKACTGLHGRQSGPEGDDGSPDDPQSLNRYVYVLDDPVNLTDPEGLTHGTPYGGLVFEFRNGQLFNCSLNGMDFGCDFIIGDLTPSWFLFDILEKAFTATGRYWARNCSDPNADCGAGWRYIYGNIGLLRIIGLDLFWDGANYVVFGTTRRRDESFVACAARVGNNASALSLFDAAAGTRINDNPFANAILGNAVSSLANFVSGVAGGNRNQAVSGGTSLGLGYGTTWGLSRGVGKPPSNLTLLAKPQAPIPQGLTQQTLKSISRFKLGADAAAFGLGAVSCRQPAAR